MEQKNIIAALLFFLLFLLWNMFGCGCLIKFKIRRGVNRLPITQVVTMHTRAHTIDYNRYNIVPAHREYFRLCIAKRYRKEISAPVAQTIQIQQKQEEEQKKHKVSRDDSISVPRVDSVLTKPLIESADPIRNHPHVSSIIE